MVGTPTPHTTGEMTVSAASNETPWGRVDDDRTAYVREGESERVVGSFPDGSPEEALAYFQRKFNDLEGQVTLLEARIARGTADASAAETVSKLQEQLVEPAAVGDLASLRARVEKLAGKTAELSEKQQAVREAARQEGIAKREAIAGEAGRPAGQAEAWIRWKETSRRLE